ncbi:hypothetical protein FGE12_20095 [Aggregicoccus sp. 17bor-14]|uniref:hypothetical protein n=1 Tax=Myxococcaceae TaxID=31 RepID=UPI0012F0221F|nr:hypothetical protein [Simulacricoccus sp. 17bor-14]MRI90457.1 hypothetical protein [Aggregicoccus sp. 17bor-14]
MRVARLSRAVALAALLGGAASAHADPNDLRIYKLGNPATEPSANGDFQAFARTFGAALSSVNLMPPETLGHAGFSVNGELTVARISSSTPLPTEGRSPTTVLMPSLHVRKGLPFSVELGARSTWVEKSGMAAFTGEVKVAITEGFTYLPDVGARLHATRLLGNRDFSLTTGGLDVGVGKQFPIGGMVTLTPYGGLDLMGVAASANNVNFRPDRPGGDTLGPDAALADRASYAPIGLTDHLMPRIYGGARFIGGVLQLGAEVSFTQVGSVATGVGTESRSVPGVLTFNTTLGLDF